MFERKFITKVGLTLALGIGAAACTSSKHPDSAPASQPSTSAGTADCIGPMTDLRIIGPTRTGGFNAVNAGECAEAYDPQTYKKIGEIGANKGFVIECSDGPKPIALRIMGSEDDVNLGGAALSQFNSGALMGIPSCS